MIEMTKHLLLPLDQDKVEKLRIGDEVYLSGIVYIMRDATLRRIFDENLAPPEGLNDQVILFGAPSFIKESSSKYKILSVGVTTAQRMERFIPLLLSKYGVRGIIGKGELSEEVTNSFKENRAVYFLFVGGAAALATSSIVEVERVWWEDLYGEALFKVKVSQLGPMYVAIDSQGSNLLLINKKLVMENLRKILGELK
jgi:tartrate/fumarate subfamily iron-sulfur-dependent hydro-lyase beta chain